MHDDGNSAWQRAYLQCFERCDGKEEAPEQNETFPSIEGSTPMPLSVLEFFLRESIFDLVSAASAPQNPLNDTLERRSTTSLHLRGSGRSTSVK